MPLEVSPGPFQMRLPYTPLFDPQTTSQPGGISAAANGPAAAGASAIIPPNPGGIANPHAAIPALAEAGYTAPQLRPAPTTMNHGGPTQTFPASQSIYAGGSMYGGTHPRMPHPDHLPPLSDPGSEGWYTSSLPAPRPAPRLQTAESVIAPRQHHHATHHRSPSRYDDDDGRSDVSYYARPKFRRHRSGSVVSSHDHASSVQENHHRRSGSLGHHHRYSHSHRGSPHGSPLAGPYSPNEPSPLSLASGAPPPAPSSLGRSRSNSHSNHHKHVPHNASPELHGDGKNGRPHADSNNRRQADSYGADRQRQDSHRGHGAPEPRGHHSGDEEKRGRTASHLIHPSEYGSHRGEPRQITPFPQGSVNDDTQDRHVVDGGSEAGAETDERRRQSHKTANTAHSGLNRGRKASEMDDRYNGEERHRERGESPATDSDREHNHQHRHHHHHHERRDSGSDHETGKDHRRRGLDGLPPFDSLSLEPRRRSHSHSHSHHRHGASTLAPPAQAYSYRTVSPPLSVEEAHLYKDPYRRQRAVSMQCDEPHAISGGGLYQAPSVVGGGPEIYDDGASVAGSAMTFMDGPMAGRTSQYGLPKYAHAMKPDPRRFMVQRGNADVYLN